MTGMNASERKELNKRFDDAAAITTAVIRYVLGLSLTPKQKDLVYDERRRRPYFMRQIMRNHFKHNKEDKS